MSHTSFLAHTAQTLYQQYKENIGACCLVFPGRRAALFFQKELSVIPEREIWMPTVLGITQLIEKQTGQRASDPYVLLLELFKVYKELTGKTENLEQFVFLGNTLLHDFDQADKYLLNPEVLFHNVRDLQQIENDYSFLSTEQKTALASFWSAFSNRSNHPLNKHFITLWEILPELYSQFNRVLNNKGLAYEGLLYKKMVQELESNTGNGYTESFSKFVFIGFNALNPCEKKLFHFLKDKNKAAFFWDYDSFYTEDTLQEAGMFLRNNIKEFPSVEDPSRTDLLQSKKEGIQVISVPSRVMQARIVPQILKEYSLPFTTNTAVVLSDEDLLVPLLYALGSNADEKEQMNATMGFPLSQTSLFSLIQSLLYYFFQPKEGRDFLPVNMHPYVQALGLEDVLKHVPKDTQELYEILLHTIERTEQSPALTSADPLLATVAGETKTQINRLYQSVCNSGLEINPSVFADFTRQQLSLATIPFSGEPLSGLQIMGLLETRCLDFENLILISSQDNLLPRSYKEQSVIPYNLRKAFGLPAAEQHTAIRAYYFYRLLQRAKKVFLIYNSNPDSAYGGEISRFVRQISHELPNISVTYTPLVFDYKIPQIKPLVVYKKDEIKDRLQAYLYPESGKTLSPTALLSYIRCPLQFFFTNIKSLKEPEILPGLSDTLQIGNKAHAALEQLYRPVVGKTLEKEDVLHLIHRTRQQQDTGTACIGEQVLFDEIATFYTKRFVTYDAGRAPFTVLATEKKYAATFKHVAITGVVDRIDRKEGQVYLIDYKTGMKKNTFNRIEDLFSPELSQKNGDIFQVLCYTYLFGDQINKSALPIPLVFYLNAPLSSPSDGFIIYNKNTLNSRPALASLQKEFLAQLDALLKELFNFSVPFKQTEVSENCTYCPYTSICQREKIND